MTLYNDFVSSAYVRAVELSGLIDVDVHDLLGIVGRRIQNRPFAAHIPCTTKAGSQLVLSSRDLALRGGSLELRFTGRHFGYDASRRHLVRWTIELISPSEGVVGATPIVLERGRGEVVTVLMEEVATEDVGCGPAVFYGRFETVASDVPNGVVLHGRTGTLRDGGGTPFTVTVTQFLFSGSFGERMLPTPRLSRVELLSSTCQGGSDQRLSGQLVLTGLVPPGLRGSTNELRVSLVIDPPEVTMQPPSPLRIRQWQRTARFTLSVPPEYSGPITVTAVDEPTVRPARTVVHPIPDNVARGVWLLGCGRAPDLYDPVLWDVLTRPPIECLACRPALINDYGDVAGVDGEAVFRRMQGSRVEYVAAQMPGQVVLAGMNGSGDVAFTVIGADGKRTGYVLQAPVGHEEGVLSEAPMALTAITDTGDVGGFLSDGDETIPVIMVGGKPRELGEWPGGIVTAMSDSGLACGFVDKGELQCEAFLYRDGETVGLPTLGGTVAVPLAINRNGVVVGWSTDAKGTRRAFAFYEEFGLIDLGTFYPDGRSRAHDINDRGVVVGMTQQDDGTGAAGFLYTADTGMIDLNSVIQSESRSLKVLSAVRITNGGDILTHCSSEGKEGYYIFRPLAEPSGPRKE